MSKVSIRGLVKRYGAVAAVSGVDLEIAEGELLVLLGPSGCGKTTTLRCIAGLEHAEEGEISVGGRVVSSAAGSVPPERRGMGMVFQSYAIWPHLSVFENVAFSLKLKKVPHATIDERVTKALDLVGLGHLGKRASSHLSGGQQQRVALARAIAMEPGVLLFDEPLSNLDAKLREKMRFELRQLQKRLGITSIYVTHDQQEAMVIADRVVLMNGGKIEQIGSPIEIYQRPNSVFGADFIGLSNIMECKIDSSGPEGSVAASGDIRLHSRDVGFTPGEKVHAIVRPENIQLSAESSSDINTFGASVEKIYFLGNIADVYLRVGQLQLRGQVSPPQAWEEGRKLQIRLPPESVVLLRHN